MVGNYCSNGNGTCAAMNDNVGRGAYNFENYFYHKLHNNGAESEVTFQPETAYCSNVPATLSISFGAVQSTGIGFYGTLGSNNNLVLMSLTYDTWQSYSLPGFGTITAYYYCF